MAQHSRVAPSINNNGLTPSSGPVGKLVAINGLNFGATQSSGNGSVTFNGKQATISSRTSTQIKATVPMGTTTGPLIVTANGMQSNGETFTVNSDLLTYRRGNLSAFCIQDEVATE